MKPAASDPGTMKYASVEPISCEPGESAAVKFIDDDGMEHDFIVITPVGKNVASISIVTDEAIYRSVMWAERVEP